MKRLKKLSTIQKSEVSEQFASLVDCVQKLGIDNISQISRQTRIPIETVRYKIKRQLPSLGINVRLRFDENRLGLQLIFAELQFAKGVEEYASQILLKLSDVAFLTYQARELGTPFYQASFAVPFDLIGQWREFLNKLKTIGILDNYVITEIRWRRMISINPEYFDFASKLWRIDARRNVGSVTEPPPQMTSGEFLPDKVAVNIDKTDLLIIKEMQKNATLPLSKISRILSVNEKTLGYHYRRHVRSITPQTLFIWSVDSTEDRKQTMLLRFVFKDLTDAELEHSRRIFNSFPFTWGESGGRNGLYVTEIMMPLNYYSWTMRFLRTALVEEYGKVRLILLDRSDDMAYTIPYKLFDEKTGEWFFDDEKAISEVLNVVPHVMHLLNEK